MITEYHFEHEYTSLVQAELLYIRTNSYKRNQTYPYVLPESRVWGGVDVSKLPSRNI